MDRTLKAMVADQLRLDELESEYGRQAAELKARYQAQTKALQARLAGRQKEVKAFCESRPEDFEQPRNRRLTWGTVGFRQVASVKLRRGVDYIELLKEHGLYSCIKTVETIKRTAMAELPDDMLRKVQARKVVTDTFYVETRVDAAR